MKETSQDLLSADWEMLQELSQSVARQIGDFAPTLPEAIERLARLESQLIEITGIDSPAFARQGAPISEELHWLRDRLDQAASDAESMLRIRNSRDANQMIESMTAAMRFTIAAVGIVRLALDMIDRLSSSRVGRPAPCGEAP